MVLSKLIKYPAIGIGLIIFGEIYYGCVKMMRDRLQLLTDMREITECFHTRTFKEEYSNSLIVRQINFCREPSFFITEILEKLILSSERTIHIAMYIFTNTILASALKSVHEKGVKIYVIVDHTMEAATGTQIQNLKQNGVAVKICYSSTLHHKFCLIDVPYKNDSFETLRGSSQISQIIASNELRQVIFPRNGLLISGSLNWTQEALMNNYENFIVTSNNNITIQYFNEFVERWNSSNDA